MFSKTRFFFTKNSSVINMLAQNKGCRLSIASRHAVAPIRFSRLLNNFNLRIPRFYSTSVPLNNQNTTPIVSKVAPIAKNIAEGVKTSSSKPLVSNKSVAYWLICTSGLVFGIVVLGGLTRLTESGLSITEWKPVTGAIPPLNEAEWEAEFTKYKDSPEFKQLNSHITLEEFKFIFSMEWGHRLVGRCIGLFFVLPALYLWKTKKFSPHVGKRVIGLTGLLGLQGFIGWWMVKSGLDEDQLAERNSKPTVSQYRLTTHLGAAFLMYLGVLWTAFEILNENKFLKQAKKNPLALKKIISQLSSPAVKSVRSISTGLLWLAFVTAMSGGMVAGLDAGLIYNTFPHMGDDYIPSAGELMSPVFARKEDLSDMWWRNLLENPTTVQLVHRTLATTTFFAVLGAHMFAIKRKDLIPKQVMKSLHNVMGIVTLQVALGITTLIYLVPIPLAAAHQAGALALLTACLAFSAKLRKPRPQVVSYINKYMKDQLLAEVGGPTKKL
ncbi:cytochrome c oxidase assembly protein COX15 [Scheffersomyces xylosifermentans]|uniref:cytochrome c oxidase assembly protein COX15 n=1 Tax=Scheffersomyces xylosifermentans TaxID=1304137 RepID=UPI00315CBD98